MDFDAAHWAKIRALFMEGIAPDPWDAAVEQLRLSLLADLEDLSPVVFLYGEIGDWDVSAREFVASLPPGGDLEVHVNSPGGSAWQGMAIYSALLARPGRVKIVVDGLAASVATVIMQAASPGQLEVSASATVMVHESWVEVAATADELRRQAAVLDGMNDVIASVYAWRTGLASAHWKAAMKAETWYAPGQRAVDARLADAVAVPPREAAAAAGYVPSLARRAGVLAAAGPAGPQGVDSYGHPVLPSAKREAFARYEQLRRAHEARRRAGSGRLAAQASPGGHSAFARATFGVD
jgi:ATP-dependent protease ClpP protease subunit